MSLTKAQANTNTVNAVNTINTAQDTLFIANADLAIATAISFGNYSCTVTSLPGVNLQTVFTYYANLGYVVTFPDVPQSLNNNPAQLFGSALEAFFFNVITNLSLQNPVRMTINWS